LPVNGRDFGIDTDRHLNALPGPGAAAGPDWATIMAWRPPAVPTFAARYFFPGHLFTHGELNGVRHAQGGNPPTNPDLAYILPIQGPGAPPFNRVQGLDGGGAAQPAETVQGWGDDDATSTCNAIVQAVRAGDLAFTFLPTVIVYLDVEPGVQLSADYWYGWASRVYWYTYASIAPPFLHLPFYPGVYCTTNSTDPGQPGHVHHRIPSTDVRDGLTKPPNNLASRCYGVWAANPLTDNGMPGTPNDRFAPGFEPDWENRFSVWQQTVHVIFGLIEWHTDVPVRVWQYTIQAAGHGAFNALHVDLDETSPDFDAVGWMLHVP